MPPRPTRIAAPRIAAGAHAPWVDAMLLAVVLLWGLNFLVMKVGVTRIDRDVFNAARFLVGLGFAIPLALRGPWRRLSARDWGLLVAVGLLGNFLYQVAFAAGVEHTSPGRASVMLATTPLWVALISFLRGDRVPLRAWIGLALAFGCVAWLLLDRAPGGGGTLAGDLVMLGSAVLWSGYIAASKPALARATSTQFHGITMVAGTIALIALALPSLDADAIAAVGRAPVLLAIAYAGGLSIGLCFLAWSLAIHRTSSAYVANYQNLVPVVALVAEAVLMPEAALAPAQWGLALGVVAGVWVTRRGLAGTGPRG